MEQLGGVQRSQHTDTDGNGDHGGRGKRGSLPVESRVAVLLYGCGLCLLVERLGHLLNDFEHADAQLNRDHPASRGGRGVPVIPAVSVVHAGCQLPIQLVRVGRLQQCWYANKECNRHSAAVRWWHGVSES